MGGLMGMIAEWFGVHGPSLQTASLDSGMGPDSFDMQVENASLFWQGILLRLGKEAVVTFMQLDQTGAWQKPLSNGIWGEDVLEVMDTSSPLSAGSDKPLTIESNGNPTFYLYGAGLI